MAIPELLNVTHSVDLTVNRVDDKVNRVDEKVMVLIDGGQKSFPWLSAHYLTCILLDAKETNAVILRSVIIADEEKCMYPHFTAVGSWG